MVGIELEVFGGKLVAARDVHRHQPVDVSVSSRKMEIFLPFGVGQ
jgi:hypothetical protein